LVGKKGADADSGIVDGILCICYETTSRVIGDGRLRTLRDLGRTLAIAKTPEEACESAAEILGANPADIPFSLLYLLDDDAKQARLIATSGFARKCDAGFDSIELTSSGAGSASWPFDDVLETGSPALVVDLSNRFGALPGGPWPESPEKIVLNLLSNAFKFTLEGQITVTLRDAGAHVDLSVTDTGTGIAEDQLPHIFERFHRIEGARARTYEGTGIGLALVQELVKLHGGSVGVKSGVRQGSIFTVSIPKGTGHLPAERIRAARHLATTALAAGHYLEEALRWLPDGIAAPGFDRATEVPNVHRNEAEGPRPRIVWADDNADMREYVGRLLSPLYDVEAVADGEAALAAVRRRCPDLVLADVMMPRLDGFGLLRALRSDERMRSTPLVLLSARAGEESRVEGMTAGADDYLVKPFSARELLARVDAHIKMARLRAENEKALRDREEQLKQLNEELEGRVRSRTSQINALFVRLVSTQEEERRRIARDIHDHLGQGRGSPAGAAARRRVGVRPQAEPCIRSRERRARGGLRTEVSRLDRHQHGHWRVQPAQTPVGPP
jgi:DNA-binding response OmpR family regulator